VENSVTWDYDIQSAPNDHLFINTDASTFLDGIIDEVRISDTARNSSWIETCYNNQLNPDDFYDVFDDFPLSDWQYRKKITIDHTMVDDNLYDFPVLIDIGDDGDLASYAQVDFDDIMFTLGSVNWAEDRTPDNRLDHEIESFDNTDGNLTAWVKVPFLSSTVDTTLYLYYGNTYCNNQENILGVWTSGYRLVQHLDETGTGTRMDSTAYSNDGSPGGYDGDEAVSGMIDGADDFDGTDDNIDCGNDASLNMVDNVTVETWLKLDSVGVRQSVITKYDTERAWILEIYSNNKVRWLGQKTGATPAYKEVYSNTVLSIDMWYHIVCVFERPTFSIYINGNLDNTISWDYDMNPTPNDHLLISNSGNTVHGIIDEARVSHIVRNASWVLTEYNNQVNPAGFIDIGEMEDYNIPFLSDETPADNSADIPLSLSQLSIRIEDRQSDSFNWTIETSPDVGSSFGTDEYDGVKTCSLSGLNSGVTYTWFVNSTDSGSKNWSNATFSFMMLTYLNTWQYRNVLRIDHSMVAGDLVDFPVLIELSYNADLADYAQVDFDDILFTNTSVSWSTGTTSERLDHEIESFDKSDGNLTVWVRIPYLSSSVDTGIYMYFGNSTCDSMQNPVGVWDSNYVLVQHLNETGTGTRYDSTSYSNDGSPGGYEGDEATDDGIINGADILDGTDDYINCGYDPSLNIQSNLTVETWVKHDTYSRYVLQKRYSTYASYGIDVGYPTENMRFIVWWGASAEFYSLNSNVNTSDGVWHHVVGTYDGSTLKIYVDGVLKNSMAGGQPIAVDSGILQIGNAGDPGGVFHFDGTVDEVRVSDAVRDDDWVETCYNNQFNPGGFVTLSRSLTNWAYRKEITIDHTMVDDNLFDFPVLIDISDDGDLAAHAQVDFDDILFTLGSVGWVSGYDFIRLNHEIESFDSSDGNLTVWVRVPFLSSSVDTVLYMYYGNSTCDGMGSSSGVWSSGYRLVQHLNESGTGTRYDSTSFGNDGVPGGYDGDEAVSGMIDGADDFDGTDDVIDCGNDASLNIVDNITVETWLKLDSVGVRQSVMSKYNTDRAWILEIYSNNKVRWLGQNTPALGQVYSNAVLSTGVWYHIVGVFERPTFSIYINGNLDNTVSWDYDMIDNPNDHLLISNAGNTVDGIIDEVRVSDVVRNASWVDACYGNQLSPGSFFDISIEIALVDVTPPEITNVDALPDPQEIGGYVNITCDVTDNVDVDVVNVSITGPGGFTPVNVTMTEGSYYYNTTYTIVGTYTYFIWANDTSDNRKITSKYSFNLTPSLTWWNSGWLYRKEIRINHTMIDTDLTNFPILINISDTDLKNNAQSDGDDIALTDIDGNQLSHEIEYYDNTTGDLICWVNTSVSSTVDTILYMYYGNPSCSSQENKEDVWDSDYLMVQHLNETSGIHIDSTAYDHDGTCHGSLNQNAVGIIDGADSLDGSNDYIDVGTGSLGYSMLTLETWFRYVDAAGCAASWEGLISKDDYKDFILGIGCSGGNEGKLVFYAENETGSVSGNIITPSSFNDDNWHLATVTINGSFVSVYVDGNYENGAALMGNVKDSNVKTTLGAYSSAKQFF